MPVFSPSVAVVPRGYIDGLTLAPTGAHSMNIGAGMCATSDGLFLLSSPAFQKSGAAWAAGSGNGSLDTGIFASASWYWWFEIFNPSLDATDFICSLAVAGQAPAIAAPPSGWTSSRYIGSWFCVTGGVFGPTWAALVQNGDDFTWDPTPATPDVNGVALGLTNTLHTLASVPLGVKVKAKLRGIAITDGVNNVLGLIYSPDEGSPTANSPVGDDNFGNNTTIDDTFEVDVATNLSGQVGINSVATGTTLYANVIKFSDARGKNA